MDRYLARRLLQMAPLLVLCTVVSFTVMQLAPGGPLSAYEHSPSITAAQLKIITHDLGLDQPAYVQYWRWLTGRLDTPWYPGVLRLFRQRAGNWDEVVADLVRALRAQTARA